jgi:hypothetical protein
VLARHNIQSLGLSHLKLSVLLRPVKGHQGFTGSSVSAAAFIGQTGRSVDIRLKEHQRHIRLEHPDRSAVAEHSIDQGQRFQFHSSSILYTKTRCMNRIVRDAIEIELHPYNINREGGVRKIPSSVMLRRGALVITDVSEECSASIIRVMRIGELGTLAVTSNRRTLRRNTMCCVL